MARRQWIHRTLWLAATFTLLLAAHPGLSQSSKPTLVAKKDIGIYSAPRNGLFCQRGKKIGKLKKGEEISAYEEIPAYCGFLFEYPYLRITITTPDGKTVGYVHRTDDNGTARFDVKAQ
jgi:hypothetical protein